MDVQYEWPITYSVLQGLRGELYFANVPRCASQSINSKQIREFCSHEDIIALPHRIAFVRQPISWFKSSWNWAHDLVVIKGERGYPIDCPCENYKQFVDYSFKFDDRHWRPQTQLFNDIADNGKPTHYFRFDQITDICIHLFGKPLPHHNYEVDFSKEKYAFGHDDYMIHELRERYEADFELYDRALGIDALKEIF